MHDRTTGKAGLGSSVNGVYVEIPAHNLDKVEDAWGFCLVGYFPARLPGKAVAVQMLCDSWNVSCSHEVHSSGWLIFKFNNENDRKSVLIAGPYFLFRRPLLLKNMPEFFKFDDHEIKHVPAWIKLPGLPLECWNETCLSMIVSKVGKPLHIDKKTQTKKRISHPRMLVEVDASKELVRNVTIRLPDGEFDQRVFFEWEPKFCDHCTMFGHDTNSCFRGPWATDWTYQPKENNTIPTSTAGQTATAGKEAGGSQNGRVWAEVAESSFIPCQNQEFQQSKSELHDATELSCRKELNPNQKPPIIRLEQDDQQADDAENQQQAKEKMTVVQAPTREKSMSDGIEDGDQVATNQTKTMKRKEHPILEFFDDPLCISEGPITRSRAKKMKEAC
ncbi:uncharacterized protein LOC122030430 [Zingiber officinale]|uniref:uncharacterized protein LOC122030430 n=1 Tax=Zingiber officinale TaxID=94328 RepID=UPI001C4D0D63|nr:uncharacterized protein LOC122030430 [Zingiber officinale]